MRIGFAGCHEISWYWLKRLSELARQSTDATIAAAFNLPPETGKKHSAFVGFDSLAAEYGFPLHLVSSLSTPETLQILRSLQLDVLFIVGWHKIVPQEVIDCAPYCLGIHSSLLPKNRGSSPINWALIRGEGEGGMSLFHLTTGVDSGSLVAQKSFLLLPEDTCKEAYDGATVAALELLEDNWHALCEKRLRRIPQDESQATYNERRRPEDGIIDWTKSVEELHNWVRALAHPYPGAFTIFRGRRLFVWQASFEKAHSTALPGTIVGVGDHISVAVRGGHLKIRSLTCEGALECSAAVFSAAYKTELGERLG